MIGRSTSILRLSLNFLTYVVNTGDSGRNLGTLLCSARLDLTKIGLASDSASSLGKSFDLII
jgi:2-phospho-L-lactate transferase/gluconeogenesis factor (CofD/UPF0052 family)